MKNYYIHEEKCNRSFYDRKQGKYFKECFSTELPIDELPVTVIGDNNKKIFEGNLVDETENYVLIKKKKRG